jgi:4-amino-4-deoxy-L-arabinose transferase-like glycosyltransferase
MSSQGEMNRRWSQVGVYLLLAAITGAGFWLRWRYAQDVSFFVDEYLTARAADRILSRGVPLLPSGNFYSHGLLLSYMETVVLGLGGSESWLMRLPVLLLSTAAIPLGFWFGRRIGSPSAGLVAAALLAFSPESILWGGRLRMYGTLQFFVLLATIAFYMWVVEKQDRASRRWFFTLAFWAALFSHAEAMLLLPVWGLWALAQRGWRWCLRVPNLLAFALAGAAVAAEWALRRIGPPVQSRVSAGILEPVSREYLTAGWDWPGVQKVITPLFLTPVYLPLTLVALAGILFLALGGVRRRLPAGFWEQRAMIYLYALVLPVLALLLFGVDPSWKSPRYGLMLLPHYFLIAGLWLAWLGRWLQAQVGRRWGWAGTALMVILISVLAWPSAQAATRESVPAYKWGFSYVEEHGEPDDAVITFLCPAAFLHLGKCDYLAIPEDFSGFAFQKEGRWVSGWDEVPILDSAGSLQRALAAAPEAWFVIDEGRFARRYENAFLQVVWDEMELVAAEGEMLVFRSRAGDPPVLEEPLQRPAEFGDGISLIGHRLQPAVPEPGSELKVLLHWAARSRPEGRYTVFLHLLDGEGQLVAQADGEPLGGLFPTTRWQPGVTLPDTHAMALPGDLKPGRYRLVAGLYDGPSGERLVLEGRPAGEVVVEYVWIGERPPVPRPQYSLEASWVDGIELHGYDLTPARDAFLTAGQVLAVTLHWRALEKVDQDYTVFVHLVDGEGEIQGQSDSPPLAGRYPTSHWHPGEVNLDEHQVALNAEAPTGEYRLVVGLYNPEDGARLVVSEGPLDGQDSVLLARLRVR